MPLPPSKKHTPDDHAADEQAWGKAVQLAKSQGHDLHDYAFLMGAFKAQNPERFAVRPSEKADMGTVQFVRTPARVASTARRVARLYGERVAYEEGLKDLDGLGWVNGTVEDNEFHGEGSLFPPGRDGQGGKLQSYAPVPTNSLTKMLSRNKAPKTAGGMSHEDAMRVLRKENPDWPPSELEEVVSTTSPRMGPEARRVWNRYHSLVK
jgi:hypothetical protein